MPSPILHLGATVTCLHAGSAMPLASFPRVRVNGQPVVTLATTYTITGCSPEKTGGAPCATAQWITGATRVFAGGTPVLVQTGQAICTPTATGLLPLVVQTRGLAT